MADFKSSIKRAVPGLFALLHKGRMAVYCLIGRISREKLIGIWYSNMYHKKIDLEHPQDIDEKVNWMKLHADLSLWTRCADKAEVRGYVQEKGLGHTLNECYGVYDSEKDVDFSAFPDRFVIKTTNGGGGNSVMIADKSKGFDENQARRTLGRWLRTRIGHLYVEPHYFGIRPRLLAEKFLEPDEGETSLVDIKINCFDGRAYSVFLCSDREPGRHVHYSVYDLDWQIHPEKVLPQYRTDKVYPRPKSFDEMIRYSETLSRGIPYVRVDWYEIEGKPVFSEMTFTPAGGFQGFYTMDYLRELGDQMTLPL